MELKTYKEIKNLKSWDQKESNKNMQDDIKYFMYYESKSDFE